MNNEKKCDRTKNGQWTKRKDQNKKNKYRGGKPNRKPATDEQVPNDRNGKLDGMNDVSWYSNDPTLLKDAASINFSRPAGVGFTLRPEGDSSNSVKSADLALPGVLNLCYVPVFGRANTWTDPVNVAARRIYSYVRHANSGHANYDAPDLMLYLLAADGAYTMLSLLQRTYAVMNTYSIYNRYFPRVIVEESGFDFDDLMANKAAFRYAINQYATKLGSICIPKGMSIFERHYTLPMTLVSDSDSDRAQVYMFTPAAIYQYTGKVGQNYGLKPVAWYTKGLSRASTFAQAMEYANTLLDAILIDEDMNIMSGDILKAYGAENLWHVGFVDELATLAPKFDPEMLMQIHNCDVCSATKADTDKWTITQNVEQGSMRGCLQFNPTVNKTDATNLGLLYTRVLDVPTDSPSAEMVMVASRLKLTGNLIKDGTSIYLHNFGSEIVPYVEYAKIGSNGTVDTGDFTAMVYSDREKFRSFPMLYHLNAGKTQVAGISGDMTNVATVDFTTMERMNGVALTSMLTSPAINTFVK